MCQSNGQLASSREQGLVEGRAEGRNEGLLAAIESLCDAFGIELNAERTQQLAALDANQLKQVADTLATERKWPDGF